MARTLNVLEPEAPATSFSVTRFARNHAVSPGHVDALPTAENADRGALAFIPGGVGTADAFYWGRKTSADAPEWVQFGTTVDAVTFIINGSGSPISTGVAGDLYVPYTSTITAATALADQVGSIVVDVWADTFANYPPTDVDSITAAAPITISTNDATTDTTLTGWTTSLLAGSTLRFNVDSCSTITRCTITLSLSRTI
jgi:hypothetical protein